MKMSPYSSNTSKTLSIHKALILPFYKESITSYTWFYTELCRNYVFFFNILCHDLIISSFFFIIILPSSHALARPSHFGGESDASDYSNYKYYLRTSCRKDTHFHWGSAEAILLSRFRELLLSDERIGFIFKGLW